MPLRLKFTKSSAIPLCTLTAEQAAALTLTGEQLKAAKAKQKWEVRAPESFVGAGVISCQLVCIASNEFAMLKQIRQPDGTETITAPEYYQLEKGDLLRPAQLLTHERAMEKYTR